MTHRSAWSGRSTCKISISPLLARSARHSALRETERFRKRSSNETSSMAGRISDTSRAPIGYESDFGSSSRLAVGIGLVMTQQLAIVREALLRASSTTAEGPRLRAVDHPHPGSDA